jgi:hypothetical protein
MALFLVKMLAEDWTSHLLFNPNYKLDLSETTNERAGFWEDPIPMYLTLESHSDQNENKETECKCYV